MPFAEDARRVADGTEHFREGNLPLRQAIDSGASIDAHGARAQGKSAGKQGRTAGRTLALDAIVQESNSLRSERVDAWCRRTAQDTAAVAAWFAIPKIVG